MPPRKLTRGPDRIVPRNSRRGAGRGSGQAGRQTDRRIDALLTLLADNPMIVISGEKSRAKSALALIGVALGAAFARAGRARQGTSAHRLPHRTRAGRAVAKPAAPPVARHAVRQAYPSLLQSGIDERHRARARLCRRSARHAGASPRSKPRAEAAPDASGIRKKPRAST